MEVSQRTFSLQIPASAQYPKELYDIPLVATSPDETTFVIEHQEHYEAFRHFGKDCSPEIWTESCYKNFVLDRVANVFGLNYESDPNVKNIQRAAEFMEKGIENTTLLNNLERSAFTLGFANLVKHLQGTREV